MIWSGGACCDRDHEAMADHLWSGGDPVGRRFRAGTLPDAPTFEVIGVVANSKVKRLAEDRPNAY